MRMGRTKQLVTAALVAGALVLVGAAGPVLAEEPEQPAEAPPATTPSDDAPVEEVPVTEDPADPPGAAVGEVDGVPVAVAQALVPPAAPVADVAVPAERVATAMLDGVEVGLGEAPVPPPSVAEQVPVETPVVRLSVIVPAPPAPVQTPGAAVAEEPTVALVLAAWG